MIFPIIKPGVLLLRASVADNRQKPTSPDSSKHSSSTAKINHLDVFLTFSSPILTPNLPLHCYFEIVRAVQTKGVDNHEDVSV